MPPKPRVTREMIIDAALSITGRTGFDDANVRAIAEELSCSTQPVMYQFKTVEELKEAAFEKASKSHIEYLLTPKKDDDSVNVALNYIKYAFEEKNMYKFLFKSRDLKGISVFDIADIPEFQPVINDIARENKISDAKAKEAFIQQLIFAHGYADMIANDMIEFNKKDIKKDLKKQMKAAIYLAKKAE